MLPFSHHLYRISPATVLMILLLSRLTPTTVAAQDNAVTTTDAERIKTSQALFLQIASVLKHPRCSNCHIVGETHRIGDEQKPHKPRKVRGSCTKCHGHQNSPRAPGAADWRKPPSAMGWDERSAVEICRNLKNPETNGNRTPQDLAYHVTSSPNVLWAWHPGGNLSVPPLPLSEFKDVFARWANSGAYCPDEQAPAK